MAGELRGQKLYFRNLRPGLDFTRPNRSVAQATAPIRKPSKQVRALRDVP